MNMVQIFPLPVLTGQNQQAHYSVTLVFILCVLTWEKAFIPTVIRSVTERLGALTIFNLSVELLFISAVQAFFCLFVCFNLSNCVI